VTLSFVDVDKLKVTERLPGWRGRYFHGVNMTVAHYEFTRGASIHEHHHPQEELYEVLEGELELTVDGVWQARSPLIRSGCQSDEPEIRVPARLTKGILS
jgi:mannose-6-phosphate isomerase-like protein (cupin superfamily)